MIKFVRNYNRGKHTSKYSYYFHQSLKNFKSAHDRIKIEDGKVVISGVSIDHDNFDDFMSGMWQLANQAKRDDGFPLELKERLLKGLNGCDIHSPTFLETLDDLQHDMQFNPACAKKVNMYPEPDLNKLPSFSMPAVSPLLLKSALVCSAKYPQFNQGFLRPGYSKFGRHSFNVSGRSATAYKKQILKLNANIVAPDEEVAPEFHLEMLKLLENFGVEKYSLQFKIDYEKLSSMMMKDTSIGYLPVEFLEVADGAVRKATGLKKKDVAPIAIDMFSDWVSSLEEWIKGEKKGPPPKVSFLDVEMLKYEILWNHDELENPNTTPEQMADALEKVRLFYMASILDYMLALICYKPISETVRFYESAIGVRVEAGGLQKIWEILGHVDRRKDQQDIIDKWKKRGIDLTKMVFGQGDWSKYDQTLLAIVLLFVSLFAWPFFNLNSDPSVSPSVAKAMYLQFIASNVQKVMYVFAHGLFEVFGCMFSGKFITSIGDTIYQMLAKGVYFQRLLKKFKDDALLSDIIEYGFIIFFFYGDDHLAGWPEAFDDAKYFLYDDSDCMLKDFINFCTRVLGMNHKEKEFKIFHNLYAQAYFENVNGVFVEREHVEGPTFLKNQVAEVYVKLDSTSDYVFIDKLPYRSTVDIACKLTMTVKSSANIKTAAMSLCSFARLCSGNLEAYSMVRVLYDEISPYVGTLTWEDWDYYKNTVGENSARRVMKSGSFPSYDEIVQDQRNGKDEVGFIPKDFLGRPSPESGLYFKNGMGNDQNPFLDFAQQVLTDDKTMLQEMLDSFYDVEGLDKRLEIFSQFDM